MTDARMEQIIDYIIYTVEDIMLPFYKNLKFVRKELFNVAGDCFCFQVYYDKEYNKLYLYYKLNPSARYVLNPEKCCTLINGKLKANFNRDMGMQIEILGASGKVYSDEIKAEMSYNYVRMGTFSYWKCFDDVYRFIDDDMRFANDHNIYFDNSSIGEAEEKERRFCKKLEALNKKYNLHDENTLEEVNTVFEEYKKLYKQYYNKNLYVIDPNKVYYVYMDAFYDKEE